MKLFPYITKDASSVVLCVVTRKELKRLFYNKKELKECSKSSLMDLFCTGLAQYSAILDR